MAAPPEVNTKAMSGKFTLNKSLSDSSEEILRLQGVSWFKRRAIAMFVPILYITHTTDAASVEHVDVVQTLSGGFAGSMSETYTLDWNERDKKNDLFGFITGKSRRAPVGAIEDADAFLKEGWEEQCIQDGVVLCDYWSTPGKNGYSWKAVQTWGFAVVNEERRYVRRTTFTSPQKDGPIHARFVYDYAGTVESTRS